MGKSTYERHGQSCAGLQHVLIYSLQFSDRRSIPEYMEVLNGRGAQIATLQSSNNNLSIIFRFLFHSSLFAIFFVRLYS